MKYNKISQHITNWLKEYVESNNLKGFVIGVSGGIDSAVASTLCAKTGLPLLVIEMPIHQEKNQVDLANDHINWLKENYSNVKSTRINLSSTFDSLTENLSLINNDKTELSLANTRARLRMTTLYAHAAVLDSIVCGTGNKVEDFGLFFYTKWGDGSVDVSPIADLMKSEVYKLGEELGLIDGILNAIPTDGLWENSPTDEDQLGGTYDEFEWVMDFIEDNTRHEQGIYPFLDYDERNLSDREIEVLDIYLKRHHQGLHKSLPIPVCYIPTEYK